MSLESLRNTLKPQIHVKPCSAAHAHEETNSLFRGLVHISSPKASGWRRRYCCPGLLRDFRVVLGRSSETSEGTSQASQLDPSKRRRSSRSKVGPSECSERLYRACQHQNAGAMETPSQKTEKDLFPSSASRNSEGINRTAAQREGTSLKGKMKSENKEETRVRAGMSDPLHRLFLIFIPDISHNNNLPLVTPSNNGSEGERERGGSTGGAAQRQGHEGGNPFLLERRGVTFYFSPAGRRPPFGIWRGPF